jgi:hypothetical protein
MDSARILQYWMRHKGYNHDEMQSLLPHGSQAGGGELPPEVYGVAVVQGSCSELKLENKSLKSKALMTHTCNPSYLEG